jgi:hypothetical protein
MKKVFFVGLSVLVALSLVFTACKQTTDPEPVAEVSSFRVDTQIAEGGVLLTWEPVVNALTYEVWRQQVTPRLGKAVLLKELDRSAETGWADVKGRTNELKPNVDYRYTIIAKSNSSPSVSEEPKSVVRGVRFSDAQLPETISLSPVTGLILQRLSSAYDDSDNKFGSGNVVAAWDADDNPLVQYEVYINDSIKKTTFATATLLTGSEDTYVVVRKVLGDSTYYAPSEAAGKYIALTGSSDIGLSVTREDKDVFISFQTSDVFPLSEYELSRMKLSPVAESWTPVPLSSARLVGDNYELYDTLPANAENNSIWLYQITAKHGSYVDYAVTEIIPVRKIGDPALTFVYYRVYVGSNTNNDHLAPIIHATYNTEPEAEYALFLKQVSGSNGVDDGIKRDWKPVTPDSAVTSVSATTVKITLPEARTQYYLKVVATGTGSKLGYQSAESVIDEDYSGPPAGPIQFRDSITVGSESAALFYEIKDEGSDGTYTFLEDSTGTGGTVEYTVYYLNLFGLDSSSGYALLRAGEELKIELIPKGSAPIAQSAFATQSLTRNSVTYNRNGTSYTNPEPRYYFRVPPSPTGANTDDTRGYDIRLWVTAK